ncbi:MAG TPA: C39 family peptidase [Thermoanaerobaculia bacterium]|nr:C39 family peptidase [Thermoanaerobaculia bacterium]
MKRRVSAVVLVLLLATLSGFGRELDVTPRLQETYVWCWIAVGQMLFEYYDVPNVNPAGDYQCGIVGLLAVGTWRQDCAYRCQNCTVPAGSANGVVRMVEDYPARVAAVGGEAVPRLAATYLHNSLSRTAVEREIDAGRPFIAGISPGGRPAPWASSQHVALVVGYRNDDQGTFLLLVNDPYPFTAQNPYLAAGAFRSGGGAYWVPIDAFVNGLNWRETILVRRNGTIEPVRRGTRCCFVGPYGGDSCPLNLSGPLPLGSPCTCSYSNVWFSGRVCNP